MVQESLRSSLCTEESLLDGKMLAWADRIRSAWDHSNTGAPVLTHRKIWEWVFIIEALHERGLLTPGRRGLGFGVGQDPLAALFASLGCEIVASDLGQAQAAQAGWVETDQHAATLADLNGDDICDPETFEKNVTFRTVDMRAIPEDLRQGSFDFTWSACSFEHLGSLRAGQEFVLRQLDCLGPSGVAVHTTEFNVNSDRRTVGTGHTVLYRRRDIESLARSLRGLGHTIDIDFDQGSTPADRHVDQPPWSGPHLKIQLEEFVATSIGLIVRKSSDTQTKQWVPGLSWRVHGVLSEAGFRILGKLRTVYRRARNRLR